MFDDLRNSADPQGSFTPEDEVDLDVESLLKKKEPKPALGFKFNSRNFLGMNAFQRFVISALLLSMVCVLGTMFLMISGSIALPF